MGVLWGLAAKGYTIEGLTDSLPMEDIPSEDRGESSLISELEKVIKNSQALLELENRLSAIEERLKPAPAPKPEYEYPATTSGEDFAAEEEDMCGVGYWDDIAAGPPLRQSADGWEREVGVATRLIKTKPENYLVMRVRGNSMIDALIPNGSLILLRWSDSPSHNRIQAVWIDGGTTIKRVLEDEEHGWTLHYEDGSGRSVPLGEDTHVVGDFVAVLPPYTQSYLRKEE
jgi:SOS-response transcriptional repressor LexA